MSVQWVGQEEQWGCGCAAVAMLTGRTYQQIKEHVERDQDQDGMHSGAWEEVLAEHGYAVAKIYRVSAYPWQNCERDVWPPPPWADLHLAEVVVSGGSRGSHMVVMLADGTVLDPLTPEPRRLANYSAVFWVGAIVAAPRLPAQLRSKHRQPDREFQSPPVSTITVGAGISFTS